MAASCTYYDSSTGKGEYAIGTKDEIWKLPTLTTKGNGELVNCSPCINGSECTILKPALSFLFLDGDTNEWVERSI